MVANSKELRDIFDRKLCSHNFLKKKDTYYLETEECLCFFYLGKSKFGGQYEDVFGCFSKEINQELKNFPPYYKCDLRFTLGLLLPKYKDAIKKVFDLENDTFSNNEREEYIERLLDEHAIPFIKLIGTKKGIIQAIKKHSKLKHYIEYDLLHSLKLK